jgi:hypothetical protein
MKLLVTQSGIWKVVYFIQGAGYELHVWTGGIFGWSLSLEEPSKHVLRRLLRKVHKNLAGLEMNGESSIK